MNTRRLVVEEGGFLYDSDAYNDELPYWVKVARQAAPGRAVQPRPRTTRSSAPAGSSPRDNYFAFVRDGFDLLYREGRTQPRMMSVGLHMRLIGHPSRAAGLERVLDHVVKHEGVGVRAASTSRGTGRPHHPYRP